MAEQPEDQPTKRETASPPPTLSTLGLPRYQPHNYLDIKQAHESLFPGNSLNGNFALGKVLIATEHPLHYMFCMAAAYGLGRCYLEGDENRATFEKGLVVAIGEILAPGLPSELWLSTAKSHEKVVKVVRKIMMTPMTFLQLGIQTEQLMQRHGAAFSIPERLRLDIADQTWAQVDTSVRDAVRVLLLLGERLITVSKLLPHKMMVTMLVATLKKGSTSDSFLRKIMIGLKDDLGIDIQLSPELIKETARAYGSYMSSKIARQVVEDWRAWIPQSAMRLRLTVTQAVWEGLTGFNTVKKAIISLKNFPWASLYSIPIYQAEMEAVRIAALTIKGDEYYGFNRDLSQVGIRNYKNLATVCAHLLHRALGDDQILKAQCFASSYAYADKVNQLINDFINAPVESNAENDAINRLVRALAGEYHDEEDDQSE